MIAHENSGSKAIFLGLINEFPEIEFHLILTTGLYYRKSYLASIWKMLKEASFFFCARRAIDLFFDRLTKTTLRTEAKRRNVPIHVTVDANSDKTVSYLREIQPDLILSTFTMHILKNAVINSSKVATIGCHPSLIPRYRGLESFFWELANGETSSGSSLFLLSEKIDVGRVIYQSHYPIEANESLRGFYEKITQSIIGLFKKAILQVKEGKPFEFVDTPSQGSYFPMPTPEAYRKFKKSGRKW